MIRETKPRRNRGDGGIYQRGRLWWIKYSLNGKSISESSGSDKHSEARKLLQKRLGEIVVGRFIGPNAEKVTLDNLAADYLNDYRVKGKKSLDKAERVLKHVLPISAIVRRIKSEPMLSKHILQQGSRLGAQNGTVNRKLSALKRMFNLGIQAEKIHRKPYIPMLTKTISGLDFSSMGIFSAYAAHCRII